MKAIQKKHKSDKQKQNEEILKFYQENKVNPFGSCLPLVLQLPVFFSLFYMLRKDLRIDICGQAAQAAGLGPTCTNPYQSIIVRAVEVLYACDEALRIISEYERPSHPHLEALVVPFQHLFHC